MILTNSSCTFAHLQRVNAYIELGLFTRIRFSTCWNSISVYRMVSSLFQCRYQLTNIPPPPQPPTPTTTYFPWIDITNWMPYNLHVGNSFTSETAFYITYIAPTPMFPHFHCWSDLQPIHQAITLWQSGPFQPYTTQHIIHQAPSLGNLSETRKHRNSIALAMKFPQFCAKPSI